MPYLLEYKGRVAMALLCLTAAKLANVGVPLIMKEIIVSLDVKQSVLALPFAAYFIVELEDWLGVELYPELVFEHPTVGELARHIVAQRGGNGNAAG